MYIFTSQVSEAMMRFKVLPDEGSSWGGFWASLPGIFPPDEGSSWGAFWASLPGTFPHCKSHDKENDTQWSGGHRSPCRYFSGAHKRRRIDSRLLPVTCLPILAHYCIRLTLLAEIVLILQTTGLLWQPGLFLRPFCLVVSLCGMSFGALDVLPCPFSHWELSCVYDIIL